MNSGINWAGAGCGRRWRQTQRGAKFSSLNEALDFLGSKSVKLSKQTKETSNSEF